MADLLSPDGGENSRTGVPIEGVDVGQAVIGREEVSEPAEKRFKERAIEAAEKSGVGEESERRLTHTTSVRFQDTVLRRRGWRLNNSSLGAGR